MQADVAEEMSELLDESIGSVMDLSEEDDGPGHMAAQPNGGW